MSENYEPDYTCWPLAWYVPKYWKFLIWLVPTLICYNFVPSPSVIEPLVCNVEAITTLVGAAGNNGTTAGLQYAVVKLIFNAISVKKSPNYAKEKVT